jgi:hypothetical protein
MSPRVRDLPGDEADPEEAEDGLDAGWEPEPGPDDDGEEEPVEPLTHLDDAAYERFVANELGGGGGVGGSPPVTALLIGLILVIVLVAMLLA